MKLGSIAYINSLPMDWGILSGAVPAAFDVSSDVPAQLNQRMLSGDLTIGPVSALWNAMNPGRFYVLPDLSISSNSGVQSVLLFSRMPLPALAGHKIAVTSEGRTTPALLEILCRRRYGFRPQLVSGCDGAQGRLLIGDRALIESVEAEREGWTVTDLAHEWRQWTGLEFVFALWAVRRASADADPEGVSVVWRAIQRSRAWGLEHPEEIMREAVLRTGLDEERIRTYFSHLSYGFDASLQESYRRYQAYAVECGLLPAVSDPVFFHAQEVGV